ncbi:hypothetical protein CCACVL1_21125, partial [Corchorus capsularis]
MGGEAKPESLLKEKRNEEWELAKKQELEAAKKNTENWKLIYNRAKQYAKQYEAQEKKLMQLQREAKLNEGCYVDPKAKLLYIIIRICGISAMHPRTRKILQLLRLRQVSKSEECERADLQERIWEVKQAENALTDKSIVEK